MPTAEVEVRRTRYYVMIEGAILRRQEEMRLFEKEVPQSSSVTSLTFLVETPSTYISIRARTSAFSFLW